MAAERPPRLVRRGSKKLKNLRTYVVANGRDIMGSTQGYDDPRDRANSEELALKVLFKDPMLQHVAYALAEELILHTMHEVYDLGTLPKGTTLVKTAKGLEKVKPNK